VNTPKDSPRFGFGREKRVRWSAEFARIKIEGRRLAKGCLVGNWVERGGRAGEELRLGVVTPKSVGSAVERTRARRLLRESFRLHQGELKRPLTLVLVARRSIVGKVFSDVEMDYLNFVRQAGLVVGK
jgi:ribonuclease P protein component